MELLNASLLDTDSTRNSTFTKAIENITIVDLPRTKVLVEGSCYIKHVSLYDE
jgi:hypothetical protein